MSCPKCQPSEAPAGGVATMTGREPTIALVGNPNVGKSTLFNRITGARQRAVNAPGTTVQVATGHWRAVGARVLDLPGTYSLIATSPDEQVVTDTVSGAPGSVTDPNAGLGVDLILVILDGSSMTRSLYLLAQVAQTGRPAVAVVTMADVAEQNGEPVNVNALAKKLGIPVMAFDPRSGRDSAVLEQMIATALVTRPRVNGIVPDPNAPGYSADAAAEALASAGLPERGEREDLIGDAGCGCGCSDGSGKKSDGQTPGREESVRLWRVSVRLRPVPGGPVAPTASHPGRRRAHRTARTRRARSPPTQARPSRPSRPPNPRWTARPSSSAGWTASRPPAANTRPTRRGCRARTRSTACSSTPSRGS